MTLQSVWGAICPQAGSRARRVFGGLGFTLAVTVLALMPAGHLLAADCTDTDGDGFVTCSGCTAGSNSCGDCAEGNAAVHPGATEICNGVDDDCDGDIDLADSQLDDPDPVDGIDNDHDGQLDEGFGYCIFFKSGPADECQTGGRLECRFPAEAPTTVNGFGTLSCVNLTNNVIIYHAESLAAGNCNDAINNDCDTGAADGVDNDHDGSIDEADEANFDLTDVHDPACQTTEICDGKDNDGDDLVDEGFHVGEVCSEGFGICKHFGVINCQLDGTADCGAVAGTPKEEDPAHGQTCDDNKDNDCDDKVDADDPDCAAFGLPELCGNGIDDDGDGSIDEGFPQIGQQCNTGVGACAALGHYVCNSGGTDVECNAVAGSAPEPGTELSCGDHIDNDCDGAIDGNDRDCAASIADLGVTCSLPYFQAKPGSDCTATSIITYGATAQGVTLKADLLALNSDGSLIGSIENVINGSQAHLTSRISPTDWKIMTKLSGAKKTYQVTAPIPLLRVTGTKGSNTDIAYCSILPYLDVVEPANETISLSETTTLHVSGFLPLVNVHTLQILHNGVDILADSGINPATDFPTSGPLCTAPGDCSIQVTAGCGDGSLVDVDIMNLQVQGQVNPLSAKDGVATPNQVNTFSFDVVGLPPGGHIFWIKGNPMATQVPLSIACNVDDLTDTGIASAFGITIDSPTDQEVVAFAPVNVQGTVCGGNQIAKLSINGHGVLVDPPTYQTCQAGNGVSVPPECVVDFSENIPEADLLKVVAGTDEGGDFQAGSNRLVADALDNQGNRTFNTGIVFGLGPVQAPALSIEAQARSGVHDAIAGAFNTTLNALTSTIDPAFVIGLKESAVQDFFNEKCAGAIEQFSTQAEARLNGKTFGDIDMEPGCSCDLTNVPIKFESVDFTPSSVTPTCEVDMTAGEIHVTVHLPDIRIQVGAHDSCTDHGIFGECLARTILDITAVVFIKDVKYAFVINEEQIENHTGPPAELQVFTWNTVDSQGDPLFKPAGACVGGPTPGLQCFGDNVCKGGTCEGEVKNAGDDPGQFDAVTDQNSDIECWGADICSFFQIIGAAFIEIFTLGFADGADIVGIIDFDFDFKEGFNDEVGAAEPDTMQLEEVQIDPNKVASFGTALFTPGPINVNIQDGGLTVAFPASFETQNPDPTDPTTPGPSLTNATAPTVTEAISAADEISILIADDVFNQVFSSMKKAGKIKGFCSDLDGKTVGSLLPADCDTLTVGADVTGHLLIDPPLQGICHAIKGVPCNTLTGALKMGACVGFTDGPTACGALGTIAKSACEKVPQLNIHAADGIIMCARQDMDPKMLFKDQDASDNTVLTDLVLNDTNVVIAIDRGNDGYTGQLEDLASCFAAENNEAPDCLVYALCLDLTLHTTMGIDNSTCAAGQTGFVFHLNSVDKSGISPGVMCKAAVQTNDDLVKAAGLQSQATQEIGDSAEAFTPPFCGDGLTLGGVLDFTSADAKLFALTTSEATAGFADYLGMTGALGPPAP